MTQLICSGIRIIVVIIITEDVYLNTCTSLIIVITNNTVIKYLIFVSLDSDSYIIINVLNKTCPACGYLSSTVHFFFFF